MVINKMAQSALPKLNIGGPTAGGRTPSKTPGTPRATGPSGASPDKISKIQEQFPEAARIIAPMQNQLAQLSVLMTGQLSDPNSKSTPEQRNMARLIMETQNKQKLQDGGDGVWGQHTERALKTLNEYIKKYLPEKATEIGQLTTDKISSAAMGHPKQIEPVVSRNMHIIAKIFAAFGDTSRIIERMPPSTQLDRIPDDFPRDITKFGEIPVTAKSVNDLIALFSHFAMTYHFQSGPSELPANYQVLLQTQAPSKQGLDLNKIQVSDIIGFFRSNPNLQVAMYEHDITRPLASALGQLIQNSMRDGDNWDELKQTLNPIIENIYKSTNNSEAKYLTQKFYNWFYDWISQDLRNAAESLRKSATTWQIRKQRTRTEIISELLRIAEYRVPNYVPIDVIQQDIEIAKTNPAHFNEKLKSVPGLKEYLANLHAPAGKGSAAQGWRLDYLEGFVRGLNSRATAQLQAGPGPMVADKESSTAIKQQYVALTKRLIDEVNKLRAYIRSKLPPENIDVRNLADAVIVNLQGLCDFYDANGVRTSEVREQLGLPQGPNSQGSGASGTAGQPGTGQGRNRGQGAGTGESVEGNIPANLPFSDNMHNNMLNLFTLSKWAALEGVYVDDPLMMRKKPIISMSEMNQLATTLPDLLGVSNPGDYVRVVRKLIAAAIGAFQRIAAEDGRYPERTVQQQTGLAGTWSNLMNQLFSRNYAK